MRRALAVAAATVLLAACRQDMDAQPKLVRDGSAVAFRGGTANRPVPAGTVARSDLTRDAILRNPPSVDTALLARGHERFEIYCSPCHGRTGDGNGMIVQRGFPHPPSFHEPRLLAAPAQHFLDVIATGYGVMYPYAARVEPGDRWAIIAYIRALQASQNATLAAIATDGAPPP
jgi:mono/diheme cytochrome c family protein